MTSSFTPPPPLEPTAPRPMPDALFFLARACASPTGPSALRARAQLHALHAVCDAAQHVEDELDSAQRASSAPPTAAQVLLSETLRAWRALARWRVTPQQVQACVLHGLHGWAHLLPHNAGSTHHPDPHGYTYTLRSPTAPLAAPALARVHAEPGGGVHVYAPPELNPEQARQLAAALLRAADSAEGTPTPEQGPQ